jgi:hypothetical protein
MSFSLHHEGGQLLYLSGRAWWRMLRLARRYGWVPAGTHLPSLCIQHAIDQIARLDDRVAYLKEVGRVAHALTLERAYRVWDREHERYVSHLPADLAVPCRCHEAWAGHYGTNDGQWVTAADAGNLAAALAQALPEIPDEEAVAHKLEPDPFEPQRWAQKEGEALTDLEFFFGERHERVREFIAFCRQGGFWIY